MTPLWAFAMMFGNQPYAQVEPGFILSTMTAAVDYLPVLVHFALVIALTVGLLLAHALLGGSRPMPVKMEPYESGVWAIGSARERVPIKYYVIAMLFILFDIETVFLYPWAVVFRRLGTYGVLEMFVFIGVLGIGLVYAWKRGALEWQ